MIKLVVRVTEIEKRNVEPWYAIRFCAKLGDSATQTFDGVAKVFGDDSVLGFFDSIKNLKTIEKNVADKPQSGWGG